MAMGCEQSTSVQLLALVDGDGRASAGDAVIV